MHNFGVVLIKGVAVFCFVFTSLASYPQVSVSQGLVYTNQEAVVSVQDDFFNKDTLIHQGSLLLSNHWYNQGFYTPSTGTIVLHGGRPQTFDHNNQPVYILEIRQGSAVKLPSNITIANTLLLKEGILTPDPTAKLVMAEESVVTGGSAVAYVDGTLYHTGLGRKFYPVGNNGSYAPVTLTGIRGEDPVVGVAFYSRGLSAKNSEDMQLVSGGYFWKQTTLTGRYDGSVVEAGAPWKEAQSAESLVLAGSNDLHGRYYNLGNTASRLSQGLYMVTSFLSFPYTYFTLGWLTEDTKKLYLPNAFSPRAANPEDRVIKVYGSGIAAEDFHLVIQDTWGHIVFETKSLDVATSQGWDGRNLHTSQAASSAVFRYVLIGKFTNGTPFKKSGTILRY